MAAGGFGATCHLKRKRHFDDDDDDCDLFSKRQNLTQLPIRSPLRPFLAVTPASGHYSAYPGTLTPDSIPEDDVFRGNGELDKSLAASRSHSNSNSSGNESIIVQIDSGSDDMEMGNSSPKQANQPLPSPVRIGRARSNDLMSPVRSPLPIPPPPSRWAQDRLPTPVAPRFPAHSPFESSFASAAARQMRSHLHQTSLSPMVDAESWTPQIQHPPSPGPENEFESAFDGDSMMVMEDSNSHTMSASFSGLSVASSTVHTTHPSWHPQTSTAQPLHRHRGLALDGTGDRTLSEEEPYHNSAGVVGHDAGYAPGHMRNQNSTMGRTARLHMGYRADCEKCVAHVPGHYSHIIWS